MARILLLLRPDEGGAFRHVADLSGGLVEAGNEVAVCGPLAHREARLAGEVIPVEMAREISPLGDLASLHRVVRAIRGWNPDLVHAHGSKGSVYARAGRPAFPGVPVLYTPHGYPFAGHFTSAAARRRYRAIERALSPLATRVVCVCEAERRLACSVGPCARTRLAYNGTEPDPPTATHPALAELSASPLVVAVSGLRPGKGVETLVEAWSEVAADRSDATLAIAGDGPERAGIEAMISARGLGGSVRLLGHVEPADPVLAAPGAIFVSPSWAESFPYAVLEAMAHGRPIVATDVGGTGEAVIDAETGELVPADDAAALAAAIGRLLGDPERARRLGEAARRRHRELFTVAGMVGRMAEIYRELIDVRG